ncbi:MAG: GNAT family N-acetyltransferase [Gemmatimonadetes bacterium]|nr:MAG: GNAT family N-acetyltransferase [Gemmatimonadota bacterium]
MQKEGWTRVSVRRTHLELRRPQDLRPGRPPSEPIETVLRRPISPVEYLKLYSLVGELWLWRDRLVWTHEELERYLSSPDVYVWSAHAGGDTAGYFELRQHSDQWVEVMYFGLAPSFIGRGLGGWLLTRAAHEAFALGATRIALNTCTLDAPQALPNYLARGFTIVSEDQYLLDVPERGGPGLPSVVPKVLSRS